MEPSALYEAPFTSVHAGGPDELFAGKSNVIDGILEKLKTLRAERLGRSRLKAPTRRSWDGRGRQCGSMPRLRARRRYRSLRAPGDRSGWNGAASDSVSVLGV